MIAMSYRPAEPLQDREILKLLGSIVIAEAQGNTSAPSQPEAAAGWAKHGQEQLTISQALYRASCP